MDSKINEQQKFWSEDYAETYIEKNSHFDQNLGVKAWKEMLKKASNISSLLECGSNIGRNIEFLTVALPQAKKSIIEISKPAYKTVTESHDLEFSFNGSIEDSKINARFDLVFTIGVLIHVHPNQLLENMKKIYEYSNEYILIGEYFNRTPIMLEYQGQPNKLFKRDFGKFFIENFSAEIVDYGFLWGHLYDKSGFDDITWWLFRKI